MQIDLNKIKHDLDNMLKPSLNKYVKKYWNQNRFFLNVYKPELANMSKHSFVWIIIGTNYSQNSRSGAVFFKLIQKSELTTELGSQQLLHSYVINSSWQG